MKNTVTALALLCGATTSFAQQQPDAENLIYHQRYASAREVLHAALKADPNNAANWYLLTQTFPGNDSAAALRRRAQCRTLLKSAASLCLKWLTEPCC